MRFLKTLALGVAGALIVAMSTGAVTRVPSADGQFWDIQDTSPWAQDSGGIATGGRANPFNGFGYLKLQVRRADSSLLTRNHYLRGLRPGARRRASASIRSRRCCTTASWSRARSTPPKDTNYLRYFDSFTNIADEDARRRKSRGAARPAPSTTAAEWRWRRRPAAIGRSTWPTASSP